MTFEQAYFNNSLLTNDSKEIFIVGKHKDFPIYYLILKRNNNIMELPHISPGTNIKKMDLREISK